jgi:hypothetical protein
MTVFGLTNQFSDVMTEFLLVMEPVNEDFSSVRCFVVRFPPEPARKNVDVRIVVEEEWTFLFIPYGESLTWQNDRIH